MSGKFRRWYLALGAAAILLTTASPAWAGGIVDPAPIGANQAFAGIVNGLSGQSTIAVVCDGPIGIVPTGHPLPGQTVKAVQVTGAPTVGDGFTGSAARTIGVSIGAGASTTTPVTLRFYNTGAQIPTDILVPCGGDGTVTFLPLPSSATAQPATVKVTFTS
jgi:hypothetical protein